MDHVLPKVHHMRSADGHRAREGPDSRLRLSSATMRNANPTIEGIHRAYSGIELRAMRTKALIPVAASRRNATAAQEAQIDR